MIKKSQGE